MSFFLKTFRFRNVGWSNFRRGWRPTRQTKFARRGGVNSVCHGVFFFFFLPTTGKDVPGRCCFPAVVWYRRILKSVRPPYPPFHRIFAVEKFKFTRLYTEFDTNFAINATVLRVFTFLARRSLEWKGISHSCFSFLTLSLLQPIIVIFHKMRYYIWLYSLCIRCHWRMTIVALHKMPMRYYERL